MKKLFLRLWNSPTFTSWGNLIVTALSLMLTIPLILTKFRSDDIAVWLLFSTIIGFMHMVDFGFMPTFVRLTAYVMGGAEDLRDFRTTKNKGDGKINWPMMEKLYGNINCVYLISTVIVFISAIIFGSMALNKPITTSHNPKELWEAWYITIVGLTLSFYGKRFECILQGMNYIALTNRIDISFGLVGVCASFLTLYFGGSIVMLALVTQIFSVLSVVRGRLVLYNIEEKRFRKFKHFYFDKKIFNAAWQPSWRSAIGILGSTGVTQASGLIYAQVGDLKGLAMYLFSLKLMNTASEVSKAPYYSKTPFFSRLRAEGKIDELVKTTSKAMLISLIVFLVLTIGIITLGPFCLTLIKSKVALIDYRIWVLMIVVWFLERHHAMHAQIYSTTNHIPFYIPIFVTGLINIIFILIFLPKFGIWAFPVSQGLSNLLINNWWNVKISLKSINQSFKEFYSNMFKQIKKHTHD